jgi:hypothetical protein
MEKKQILKDFFGKTPEDKEKFLKRPETGHGRSRSTDPELYEFQVAVQHYNTAPGTQWYDKNLSEQTNKYRKEEGKQAQQQSGETKTSSSPTTQTKPYYTVLGVKGDATLKEITKAYHTLAKKHHPDRRGGNEDEFKKLNEAYECLSDAPARAWYDLTGSPPRGGHLKRKTKRRKSRRRRRRKSRRKSCKRKSRRKSKRKRR